MNFQVGICLILYYLGIFINLVLEIDIVSFLSLCFIMDIVIVKCYNVDMEKVVIVFSNCFSKLFFSCLGVIIYSFKQIYLLLVLLVLGYMCYLLVLGVVIGVGKCFF